MQRKFSNCCGTVAGAYEDSGICPKCKEHCEWELEEDREQLLDDCQLVFEDFIYLVDDVPRRSPITGTVRGLKRKLAAGEIRRCDIIARELYKQPVPYLWPTGGM